MMRGEVSTPRERVGQTLSAGWPRNPPAYAGGTDSITLVQL